MSGFRTGKFHREHLSGWLQAVCPSQSVESIRDIDLDDLATRGKQLLLLDVDNTLLPWRGKSMPEDSCGWLAEVQKHGLKVCILSNTKRVRRLEEFSRQLGVPFLRGKFKPSRAMYRMAMQQFNATPEQTVMVGDQLFTDVLGANRSGIESIWVRQVASREFAGTKISRLAERIVRGRLYRELEEDA